MVDFTKAPHFRGNKIADKREGERVELNPYVMRASLTVVGVRDAVGFSFGRARARR